MGDRHIDALGRNIHPVSSIICGRYTSDYKGYDAARMKKAAKLLEDDVLEVFISEKALRADLSCYCMDDRFAAQQYCIRQQLEPERETASSYDQDP